MANKNFERANEFFAKNEGIDKVYFTSDGNMFRAKHYAESWAAGLPDKKVEPVHRVVSDAYEGVKAKIEAGKVPAGETGKVPAGEPDATEGLEPDEKAELVKRYIELFDTKPNNFMKLETIKAKIAEKEAELAAEAGK